MSAILWSICAVLVAVVVTQVGPWYVAAYAWAIVVIGVGRGLWLWARDGGEPPTA